MRIILLFGLLFQMFAVKLVSKKMCFELKSGTKIICNGREFDNWKNYRSRSDSVIRLFLTMNFIFQWEKSESNVIVLHDCGLKSLLQAFRTECILHSLNLVENCLRLKICLWFCGRVRWVPKFQLLLSIWDLVEEFNNTSG